MKHHLDATLFRFYFCRVHSTCFGGKRPSSEVFKTSTAATGTCVIVAGQSSRLLIRAGTLFKSDFVSRKSKLKLYWSVIRPIVVYGCETWVLKESII